MTRALYPGTFDPLHHGHADIARRASQLFSSLVVAVYDSPPKKNLLFDTETRVELARAALIDLPNILVVSFTGLQVDCAREHGAQVVVRGLRNLTDFQYEQQVGAANRRIAPEIEQCGLYCSPELSYLSASIVREVASLGGPIEQWTSLPVQRALRERFPIQAASSSDGESAGQDVGQNVGQNVGQGAPHMKFYERKIKSS